MDLETLLAAPLADRVLGPRDAGFVIAEWSDPGGPQVIAALHVHHRDDEAWYVLEGTLRFRIGDREFDAPAGSGVFAPRGVPHSYENPSSERARYLLVMTPNTLRLIEEIHATADRDPAAMRALFRKYDCELLA